MSVWWFEQQWRRVPFIEKETVEEQQIEGEMVGLVL